MSNVLVIIPAYNEARFITRVLQKLSWADFSEIVVIDDGSEDQTFAIAKKSGAYVLKHSQNCGMGAATQTGIVWGIQQKKYRYFLTIDADDQQNPEDLKKILQKLQKPQVECVIGSRFLEKNKIPTFRRLANRLANILTGIIFGVWVGDSQSGLRGFTLKVAQKLDLHANGFEYCSEFVREVVGAGFKIDEVPISVYYTKESMAKGQSFSEGLKTLFKLILRALAR
jgi:glycosyltransferase involved in cell wall biosynthesis